MLYPKNFTRSALSLAALSCLQLFGVQAQAQGVATERELTPVHVSGSHVALDPDLPSSSHSISAADLARQPLLNTQDALQYVPNTMVRKLRVGDTNGGMAGRSFGNGQPQRVLAYLDGMLISNFLAAHQVPRWSMADPAEIERIDVLFGPFSALYPGNSIGSTVAISTKVPKAFEAAVTVRAHTQLQSDYGIDRHFSGHQQSAYIGNRFGNHALSLTLQRTQATSQGSGYALVNRATANKGGTPVTGAVADTDNFGVPRLAFGNTSISDATQELAKLKWVVDVHPLLRADLVWSQFSQSSQGSAQSWVRNAAGQTVWSGNVLAEGASYTLPLMGPRRGSEKHQQLGLRLRTRNAGDWNGSVQLSDYKVLRDQSLTSNRAMDASDGVVPGTLGSSVGAGDGGTGWKTLELQAVRAAEGSDHVLTLGAHHNSYRLQSRSFNLSDWHDAGSRTDETANYFGNTHIEALYVQDAWRFAKDWKLTAGLRHERFKASQGSQFFNNANGGKPLIYADRNASGSSPKLSLSHALTEDWLLKASVGRGLRFPTVAELYQGVRTGTEIIQNAPNLKPEDSRAAELTALRDNEHSSLRVTLFQDSVRDAIFTQRTVQGSLVANVKQNVDRTRVRGVELAWQGWNVGLQGLDVQLNVAHNDSRIVANAALPASVGKLLPGVPRWRLSALTAYRLGDFQGSLAWRHEGRTFSTLDNSDSVPGTYGGSNAISVLDAKLGWRINAMATASLGVNNLNNHVYFQTHPYAGRLVYAELGLRF